MGGASVEAEVLEKQLLSQMLEAVRVTPSLHEDLQVEVMKVRGVSNFRFILPAVFFLVAPPTVFHADQPEPEPELCFIVFEL